MKTNKFLQTVKTTISRGLILLLLILVVHHAQAQITELTYHGRLIDSSMPADTNYDFEFRLFDAETGGTLLGTQSRFDVPAANGLYSVNLDFGANFPGANRWLEIAVKPAGSPNPSMVLSPRSVVTSAPYAIRSLSSNTADTSTNSLNLGGLTADQYVPTTDARLSDARFPLPGSADYIQNTTVQQRASNFNISGNGTAGGTLSANIVNAVVRYELGGSRVLSIGGTQNLFVGVNAGEPNPVGGSNTFVGFQAGSNIAAGNNNSFFGRSAGLSTSTGIDNSFFGSGTGISHSTGNFNSFFGRRSGESNTTGDGNSFFGYKSGAANSASFNSFFGNNAGTVNSTGTNNAFFGAGAGEKNTTAQRNSFFGAGAGLDNTLGNRNSFFGTGAGKSNSNGSNNTMLGYDADVNTGNLQFATAVGANSLVTTSNTIALGRSNGSDTVQIFGLGSAGSTSLCRNASNRISTCSSSLRYKTDVQPFTSGLTVVRRLRPIRFNWRDGGMPDLGFAAEEVEQIEPLLATYNEKGEIESVKYAQITTVLVNAVNQQQTQIEEQKKLLLEQQQQINALKKLVCLSNPQAEICK